jgi:hypothetical protein
VSQPIEGVSASPLTAPQVRRGRPTPHTRPSVQVGLDPAARRHWRDLPACAVQVGDTVGGFGRITTALPTADTTAGVLLTNIEGEQRRYRAQDTLLCFTAPPAVEEE